MDLSNYNDLVSVSEASKILGVSNITIKDYVERGILKGYKFVKEIKIEKASIIELLEASQIEPSKAEPTKEVVKANKNNKKGKSKTSKVLENE